MTTILADDGFHEIQLSGKQLVFLFMADDGRLGRDLPVGVLVGRGVRAERAVDGDRFAAPRRRRQHAARRPAAAGGPPAAEPPAPAPEPDDELSYAKRLQGDAVGRAGREAEASHAPRRRSAGAAAAAAARLRAAAPPSPAAAGRAGGSGAAGRLDRPGASRCRTARGRRPAIVQAADREGYPAFVLDPAPGAPPIYPRAGRAAISDRDEAEQVARRLEKEEQFKPSSAHVAVGFRPRAPLRRPPRAELSEIRPSRVRAGSRSRRCSSRWRTARSRSRRALRPRPAGRRRLFRRHALLARRDDDDVRRAEHAGRRRSPRRARSPTSRSFPRRFAVIQARAARARSASARCCWRRRSGSRPRWGAPTCCDGFPWELLGYSQATVLPVAQIASVVGVYGLSALVALVSAAAAYAPLERVAAPLARRAVVGALVVLGTARLGHAAASRAHALTQRRDARARRGAAGQHPAGAEVGSGDGATRSWSATSA